MVGHTALGHCCLGLIHWHCTGGDGCGGSCGAGSWHWAGAFNHKMAS